ncbi:methylated-DNA--[protein]-cysteine S-methyltransferase [Chromobacterium alkanivorans]|uniref:methylated-DNA--[protein]-cysteine S-methyltransferase n=1 Tax=Chromobacterium alkanivorans TaxID=1071719 RepID=UPI0019683B3E|nr:methylated-DNA--[protein]-cysteine S-methyltransferase [Chromobacterium alkanivorans]MBN3004722.1 methylated-DNA--[protein]-cysteine S-methyltransferase [Chromobacterium alkanivorans]
MPQTVHTHAARQAGPLRLRRFDTPLGAMIACASEQGLCLLEFGDRPILNAELAALRRLLSAEIADGDSPLLQQAEREIGEYFAGSRRGFEVALHLPGTAFQQAVWQLLLSVPYGLTRSYQEQAARLGRPQSVRAVAAANGANRLSVIVPCHRVLGKDGALTGYGGGLERKAWLLAHEREHVPQPETPAIRRAL